MGSEVVQLQWKKAAGDQWCLLDEVDPSRIEHYGVFVLWRNGDITRPSSVLYVGRGALMQEIARCRRVLFHGTPGLRITWASVDDPRDVDAVGAYLYQQLRPMLGEAVPSVQPMAAHLPWA